MRNRKRKTAEDLLDELKVAVGRRRGLADTAERLGFSSQYLCDVVYERRPISKELAEKMGYERIIEFEKIA